MEVPVSTLTDKFFAAFTAFQFPRAWVARAAEVLAAAESHRPISSRAAGLTVGMDARLCRRPQLAIPFVFCVPSARDPGGGIASRSVSTIF